LSTLSFKHDFSKRSYIGTKKVIALEFYPSQYSREIDKNLLEGSQAKQDNPWQSKILRRWAVSVVLLAMLLAMRAWSRPGTAFLRRFLIADSDGKTQAVFQTFTERMRQGEGLGAAVEAFWQDGEMEN
jgi:hypothetical protein